MSSEIIKKHLEEMKKQNKFDTDFVDALIVSNDEDEEGKETADKILNLIKQRYAKNKENNS
jgi:Arc/MetJ-type ribon-helix-helix transcriptional regulator